MDHDEAQRWLDGYISAWRSGRSEEISALFSEDVEYLYHPYGQPVVGNEALVSSWGENPDPPGTWDAAYRPFAVDDHKVVATGYSHYLPTNGHEERTYRNCFLLEFDEGGRCRRFTEYYIKEP